MIFLNLVTIYYCMVYCCVFTKAKPCRGTASYILAFQAEWKNTTFRPSNAQFSSLIGCAHNDCYEMWQPEKQASLEVQQVAENGDTSQLYTTLVDLQHDKIVSHVIQTNQNIDAEGHIIFPVSNVTGGFLLDGSHSLVSIITAILPSPDWFIGVHDIDLCDASSGEWRSNKTIFLFPYDAGTITGTEFNNSLNKPTNPHEKITRLRKTQLSDSERGMGYFHFTLISKSAQSELDETETVTGEIRCAASLMKWSSGLLLPTMIMILR